MKLYIDVSGTKIDVTKELCEKLIVILEKINDSQIEGFLGVLYSSVYGHDSSQSQNHFHKLIEKYKVNVS